MSLLVRYLLIGIAAAGFAQPSVSAPATEAELVESAIASATGTSDASANGARVESSLTRLREQMKRDPSERIGGVVVFAFGLDAKRLDEILSSHKLEPSRVEAKVAVSASGATYTMSFGAGDLYLLDGPFSERLEKLVGRQRAIRLLRTSQHARVQERKYTLEPAESILPTGFLTLECAGAVQFLATRRIRHPIHIPGGASQSGGGI